MQCILIESVTIENTRVVVISLFLEKNISVQETGG